MLTRIAPFISAGTVLVTGFLLLTGAKSCGSADAGSDPDNDGREDICKVDQDCEGLPHIACVGDWSCDEGQCAWDCSVTPPPKPDPEATTKCTGDLDCPGGWCDFT